jgi:hypothetical protein
MSIDEKALEAGYEAVKDEWTYLPVERADWLRAITAAITAYEAAKAPEQPDIKAGPPWVMLESGTYIWDAEKKTLTRNVASADATATVSVELAEQPVECAPFKSGETHCSDCPCRYGIHIREPKLNNLTRQDAIEDLFHAMRALFGAAYQPSRTQAETLVNTLLESLDLRTPKRESVEQPSIFEILKVFEKQYGDTLVDLKPQSNRMAAGHGSHYEDGETDTMFSGFHDGYLLALGFDQNTETTTDIEVGNP